MGRKKIVKPEATAESVAYTMTAIKEYSKLKSDCAKIETEHASMIRRGRLNTTAFHSDSEPTEDTFADPAVYEQTIMDDYLDMKEKVYLLERGIKELDERYREIAEMLFIEKRSWEDILSECCVSRMTLSRMRNEAINRIALSVDAYMEWKVQCLFA